MSHAESARSEVFQLVKGMKPGQRCNIAERLFRDAFPTHPLFEERPPEDQFLEKLVGANYGTWTVRHNFIDGHYVIGRHEPSEKIVRRDYDRRHIPLPE